MKIFGIGFHKTATSSLAKALTILGYSTIHGDQRGKPPYGDEGRTLIKLIEQGNYNLPTLDKFDAFSDNPYFSIWKELDKNYPGSKFILTIRDSSKWIESCVKYYKGRRIRPMRIWMFGEHAEPSKSEESKKIWLEAYKTHNAEILAYFRERPDDLLVMDITRGDGWEKLCPYLGVKQPARSFPTKNVNKLKDRSFFMRAIIKLRKNIFSVVS